MNKLNNSYLSNYEYIISSNKGLVYYIVNRFNVSLFDRDDLIQVGLMALLEAAKRFDVNKGVKFSTYAVPYILGSIKKELSYKVCFLSDEDIENLKAPVNNNILNKLTKEEQILYELRVIKQLSQKEIAVILNINQSTVSRKLKNLKEELKKGM